LNTLRIRLKQISFEYFDNTFVTEISFEYFENTFVPEISFEYFENYV
jgi:hypothetical protein